MFFPLSTDLCVAVAPFKLRVIRARLPTVPFLGKLIKTGSKLRLAFEEIALVPAKAGDELGSLALFVLRTMTLLRRSSRLRTQQPPASKIELSARISASMVCWVCRRVCSASISTPPSLSRVLEYPPIAIHRPR